MNEREGKEKTWKWCPIHEAWLYEMPYRIYPCDDKFLISSDNCWHPGEFDTFEEAEKEVLGL